MDIKEPIYPDRVTRQLGRMQRIPELPIRSVDECDQSKVDFFLNWKNYVIPKGMRGERVSSAWDCVQEYFGWYQKITHRIVAHTDVDMPQNEEWIESRPRSLVEELQRAKNLCRQGVQGMELELEGCIDRAYVLAKRQERECEREERVEAETDTHLTPQDVEQPCRTRMQTRQSTEASKLNQSSQPSQSSQKSQLAKKKRRR